MKNDDTVKEIAGALALLHKESGKYLFDVDSLELKPEEVFDTMQAVQNRLHEEYKLLLIEVDTMKEYAVCSIEELKATGGVVVSHEEFEQAAEALDQDPEQMAQYLANKMEPRNLN